MASYISLRPLDRRLTVLRMRFLQFLSGRLPSSVMSAGAINSLALLPVVIPCIRTCLRRWMPIDGGADWRAHGGGVGRLGMRATTRAGGTHLTFGWALVWLRSAVASRVNSTSILSLLLSLVQLCLLSSEDLLLFSKNLRIVLVLDRSSSLRGRRALDLGLMTSCLAVHCRDMLRPLPIAYTHLLALVVEAELLRLT